MDRIPDIDDERVEALRVGYLAASDDLDVSAENRRTRAEIYPGSNLKDNDDVTIYDVPEFTLRIICAARGEGCVATYYPPWFGDQVFEISLPPESYTDRAPADPEETPMPIFPEELMSRLAAKKAHPARDKHDRKKALKAIVATLPDKAAHQLVKHLKAVGALGKDD